MRRNTIVERFEYKPVSIRKGLLMGQVTMPRRGKPTRAKVAMIIRFRLDALTVEYHVFMSDGAFERLKNSTYHYDIFTAQAPFICERCAVNWLIWDYNLSAPIKAEIEMMI